MDPTLRRLAELYDVEPSYQNAEGRPVDSSAEGLLRVLQVLGAPVRTLADVPDAVRRRQQELCRRVVEPVVVAWDGLAVDLSLRLPADRGAGALSCRLDLESGARRDWSGRWEDLPQVRETFLVEGVPYVTRQLSLPADRPLTNGCHRLTLEAAGEAWSSLVIAAPVAAYVPEPVGRDRTWGIFLPLYAAHSKQSWGAGDFFDMAGLLHWVHEHGGGVVGSLPFLAAFLDEPFEPSPYSPASRLFWNEFYLTLELIPEWQRCPAARTLVQAPEFQQEVQALRQEPLVDYRRQMALKRRVLMELCRCFFSEPGDRHAELQGFLQKYPRAEDYARFRAVAERQRRGWRDWPERQRDGDLREGDYDEETRRYHLYVQWLADEQLGALSRMARGSGPGLYLDLPLGVHADGYDVWRDRDAFALGASGGAPPDQVFTGGQDWGFPPLHPERIRQQGYGYLAECLRRYLHFAGILRIDHVMGLHRLYWVPQGLSARDGVYIRYHAEELYALFSLESNRHRAVLAGEDLGTVPPEVRPAMARHGVQRMYVQQYELLSEGGGGVQPIPAGSVASVNTHDMPMFAAFWQGLDIPDRVQLGLLTEEEARQEVAKRQAIRENIVAFLKRSGLLRGEDVADVLRGLLAYLSTEPDRLVLVNVEDLWGEIRPQNTPGTWHERPNWRRKTKYPFETWSQMPEVVRAVAEIDRLVLEGRESGKTSEVAGAAG
jgi:4-alpha-glucanotransferase